MLENGPEGYVIVPASVWEHLRDQPRNVEPVLKSHGGTQPIVLLHRGGTLWTQR
jgi:hypothetical protein